MELKPFFLLFPVERAQLLSELFPEEINSLVEFIEGMADTFLSDTEAQRRYYDRPNYPFESYCQQVATAKSHIAQYGMEWQDGRHFAQKLFGGHISLFTVHCTVLFTTVRRHPNQKFVQAVELFFK